MGMRCLVFASTLMILGIVVLGNSNDTINVPQFDCGADLYSIRTYCYAYVTKDVPQSPPSEQCCAATKGLDVPCMCEKYFPQVEKDISPDKAAYVGRTCGLSIPPGLKCGSSIAPPMSAPMREK